MKKTGHVRFSALSAHVYPAILLLLQEEHEFEKKSTCVPHQEGWAEGAGTKRATGVLDRKAEATAHGREIASNQGAELLTHGSDGNIQSRDSHGHDPYPPKVSVVAATAGAGE